MFKNLVISWLFMLLICFQAQANVPDICLNDISKAACRVSAGPNRGSGVAVHEDGSSVYVLTNAHVIENYTNVTVEFYKYGAKTTPLPCKINGKVMDSNRDFAILTVSKSYFGNMLPNIIPLAPPNYQIVANTYFATAGHPFSRDMTAREGRILGSEGSSRILFTPPPDKGQSGSGLFVKIGDKVYVAGIITFKSGDYRMDMNGFPVTYGAAFNINMLRQNLTPTNDTQHSILYPVSEQLYALGNDGKWYPQQGFNAVTAPEGVRIIQWNCPSGQCRPIQQQPRMVPLPKPSVPRAPNTIAPPAQNNGIPFQNLPNGFGEEVPKLVDPDDIKPEIDLAPEIDTAPDQTDQLKELQDKYDALNTQYLTLKTEYDLLQIKLKEMETELSTKDASIKSLEDQITQLNNLPVPDATVLEEQQKALEEKQAELDKQQAQINELTIQIDQKTEQIKKYELDISMLKDMLDQVPEPTTTEPTPADVVQKPSVWNRITNTAKNLNPIWALLLGVGGTLLLSKYKLLGKIPTALIGLLKTKPATNDVTQTQPSTTTTNNTDLSELMKWLNKKFDNSSAKLDGLSDYVTSKLADTNNQSININIDNDANAADDLDTDGLDYKQLYKGAQISDRIKQFFELKKRDGDSVEKWAFYAILYKEAMQLLRRGKLEIDIVGNKVPLQGQRLAADRIDSWVREQFLKRTTIDQLDHNHLYHEAMIGFLYKEAVKLLRVGFFPVLGAKDTADAIESWVKQEFLERMGITL